MAKNLLIIGGGVAGLSAGIYAQKNGFNSTIIEMHERPGGQLTAWNREGYWFDYCLHWLVGTDHGVYNKVWRETDAITDEVEVLNHQVFVRLEDEQHGEFYIYNSLDEWEAYLIDLAPEDAAAITKMCHLMRKGDQVDQFEDAPGLRNWFDYLKALWEMGTFFGTMLRYTNTSSQEFFDGLGMTNPRLRYFLEELFGGVEFSAIAFLVMFGWFNAKNAGYLMGGSRAMADRLAAKYTSLGGEFRFNSRVQEIIVAEDQAKGVTLESGEHVLADHVISACDGHAVLFDLLKGKYLTDELREAYTNWQLFTPLVMVGVGVDQVVQSKTHISTYLREGLKIGRTPVKSYQVMNRSSYDSSFAPLGKTTLLIQFESPWELWEELEGEAYEAEKAAIQEKVLRLLEGHHIGIRDHIEVVDVATPRTTVRYTGVWKGAYEGFLPKEDTLDGLPMELEGLQNFTMIGQWLFPGGGLPPSALSGKWVIQKLCHAEGKAFMTDDEGATRV